MLTHQQRLFISHKYCQSFLVSTVVSKLPCFPLRNMTSALSCSWIYGWRTVSCQVPSAGTLFAPPTPPSPQGFKYKIVFAAFPLQRVQFLWLELAKGALCSEAVTGLVEEAAQEEAHPKADLNPKWP